MFFITFLFGTICSTLFCYFDNREESFEHYAQIENKLCRPLCLVLLHKSALLLKRRTNSSQTYIIYYLTQRTRHFQASGQILSLNFPTDLFSFLVPVWKIVLVIAGKQWDVHFKPTSRKPTQLSKSKLLFPKKNILVKTDELPIQENRLGWCRLLWVKSNPKLVFLPLPKNRMSTFFSRACLKIFAQNLKMLSP